MGNNLFKFQNFEEDVLDAIEGVRQKLLREGGEWTSDAWNEAFSQQVPVVAQAYMDEKKFDPPVDWIVFQWQGGGGSDKLYPIIDRLFDLNDTQTLVRVWRKISGGWRAHQAARHEANVLTEHILEKLGSVELTDTFSRTVDDMRNYIAFETKKLPKAQSVNMTEDLFWEVIDSAHGSSISCLERPYKLTEQLEAFSASAIKHFAQMFQQKMAESYRWDLWAVAYLINGGCSDDGFDYFRAWLISEGRPIFEAAVADPESLVDVVDKGAPTQLEAMISAAGEAYYHRANKDLKLKAQRPRDPAGTPWEEGDLPRLFPRAHKKFPNA